MTMTTRKIREGNPGSGAVEFAKELTAGMEEHDAFEVMGDIMGGVLPNNMDVDERRVKQCASCSYYFYDKTRPRNGVTCSDECKNVRDASRYRKKTEQERQDDPSKRPAPTMKEQYYYGHYEYSFWVNKMPEDHAYNYERPRANLEDIDGAKQVYDKMGGRKRNTNVDYYNADWEDDFNTD